MLSYYQVYDGAAVSFAANTYGTLLGGPASVTVTSDVEVIRVKCCGGAPSAADTARKLILVAAQLFLNVYDTSGNMIGDIALDGISGDQELDDYTGNTLVQRGHVLELRPKEWQGGPQIGSIGFGIQASIYNEDTVDAHSCSIYCTGVIELE